MENKKQGSGVFNYPDGSCYEGDCMGCMCARECGLVKVEGTPKTNFRRDPEDEFFSYNRRLDKIYIGFSAKPKKCVNSRLKLHAFFKNIFG